MQADIRGLMQPPPPGAGIGGVTAGQPDKL
jgi:hypothetical protein